MNRIQHIGQLTSLAALMSTTDTAGKLRIIARTASKIVQVEVVSIGDDRHIQPDQ